MDSQTPPENAFRGSFHTYSQGMTGGFWKTRDTSLAILCGPFSEWLAVTIFKTTWNLKHLFINGCFNWMIPNLYIGNGCFTKHPFKTGCLGYQVNIFYDLQPPVISKRSWLESPGCLAPLFWSNYSDLTRPHPKWWFSKGNPLISGKSRLVKYYNLVRLFFQKVC